jgi:tRNA A-37 threonylcarbamoyl transferase component Bud32
MRTANAWSEPVRLCFDRVDEDPGTVKLRPPRAAAGESDELVGRRLGGYVVERVIGKGGMGVVYLATHPVLGKRVAVKVIRSELAADDELRRRFMDEARTLAALDDPRIVAIQDLARLPDGRAYLVMEYVEGELLSKQMGKATAVDAAVRIVRAMLAGLAAAHARGIVHRDIKPSNVMLVGDGVKLLDFGIAKLRGQPSGGATRAGAVVGTPGYMAPEQASAKAELGPTADVYAAGVVLYELLAGKRPFDDGGDGEDWIEVLVRQRTMEPPPIAGAPSWLDAVVRRALAKDPAQRYASAKEMLGALDARAPARSGERKWLPLAIGVGAVAAAVVITWQVMVRSRSDAPAARDAASAPVTVAPVPVPVPAPADAAEIIAAAPADAPAISAVAIDAPVARHQPAAVVASPIDAGVARLDAAAAAVAVAAVARPDAGAIPEDVATTGRFELPAPPDIAHIDVTAWIPKAKQLARRIYPDAELYDIYASHVMADGTADVHDNGFVQYEFRSPSESTKDTGRCTMQVNIYYYGIRVGVDTNVWKCDQQLYTPHCSLKEVLARQPDFADASVKLRTYRGATWNLEHHGKKAKVVDDCGGP